ncbi:MAG: polyphosphate polymerase domain-containing protein [Spirochaetales bacterium]|nr:polyphosphate polymerase domain-containing protein [Spirochaetales bacterium]MBR1583861.1 polyphosphate polymerase domain-containing protein [Spirochaetales bacterium]
MQQAKLLFQRYEKKYLLTEAQYRQVIEAIREKMVPDAHARYSIKNIYFDTEDYDLIRTSVDGADYKEKLRLRAYGTWDRNKNDRVFLEIKKKYDGIVYKRRIGMSFLDAMFYVFSGERPEGLTDLETSEFDFFLKRHHIVNRTFLTYDREAYAAADGGELRITFDTNIRYQTSGFSFDEKQASEQVPVMGVLMEIKNPMSMPLWVAQMLSKYQIRPYSFSKYGAVYRNNILKEEKRCSVQLSAQV